MNSAPDRLSAPVACRTATPPAPTPAPVQRLTLANARRRQPQQPVPSPCIGVCKMEPATGWCGGCFRTIDEIASWSRLADADKLALWQHIEARQTPATTGAPA